MNIHGQEVTGVQMDSETRCLHYHSEIDRIAIKFYCCGKYFPCYECHEELGCGKPAVWPRSRFTERAVLCGACGYELAVSDYLTCHSVCPACSAKFNPGCSLHSGHYFETAR